ncbi:acyl-CoA thioesterase [Actinoplanes sp. TBRC 11911]|uniref:acyl-CoA thioesterase n=1 Tax=Actinoplanes sp. TBRC 11911 TaxID=2729386 RepID=UPI00145EDA39|nr:hotdog domain-containing protein [Actinoplanes sp. TBRC 11911]NMO54037.1 acyl-CoA thioesterase [Actinoplanes sp. TBRC 11911]
MSVEFGAVQPVEVYFDQLDALRTLHHAQYVLLVDRAVASYWEEKGYHHDAELTQPDTFFLVREISITYDQPILDYGPVLVHHWIDRIGTTSYVQGFRVVAADGGTEYAHGTRVLIKVDPKTMRPSPITGPALEDLRGLLRAVPAEVG